MSSFSNSGAVGALKSGNVIILITLFLHGMYFIEIFPECISPDCNATHEMGFYESIVECNQWLSIHNFVCSEKDSHPLKTVLQTWFTCGIQLWWRMMAQWLGCRTRNHGVASSSPVSAVSSLWIWFTQSIIEYLTWCAVYIVCMELVLCAKNGCMWCMLPGSWGVYWYATGRSQGNNVQCLEQD